MDNHFSYVESVKNARMNVIKTALGSDCKLVIGTSALNGGSGVLATFTIASMDDASGGVLTVIAPSAGAGASVNASASGTAAKAELRTSAGATVVYDLIVGTSAWTTRHEITLGSTDIVQNEPVTLSVAQLVHAA